MLLLASAPPKPANQRIIQQYLRRISLAVGDAQHGTLTVDTVAVVTLSAHFSRVTVLNRDGIGEIYFTLDSSTPVVGAEGNYVCPAAIWAEVIDGVEQGTDNKTVVKLISHTACKYSVLGQ